MMNRLCCMRLHTAGVVIGWLGAALSLTGLIIYGLMLARLDEVSKYIIDNMEPGSSETSVRRVLVVVLAINLTVTLVNLIASALLVAGTIKERHLMLIPWLVNSGISLMFSFIYYLLFVISAAYSAIPLGSTLFYMIFSGIGLMIHYLVWYAIYSLFKTIQANREQQLLRNNAGSAYPSYTKI